MNPEYLKPPWTTPTAWLLNRPELFVSRLANELSARHHAEKFAAAIEAIRRIGDLYGYSPTWGPLEGVDYIKGDGLCKKTPKRLVVAKGRNPTGRNDILLTQTPYRSCQR